ncbi:MAG: hypothetical protein ABFR47_02575 [Verrucomicrobiota bacterium]
MQWWFKREEPREEHTVSRRNDFSDCVAVGYLPCYSVCQSENNATCHYAIRYAEMALCSNPDHAKFIRKGSRPFNPHEDSFSD